jgi:puromycin-sensitive aminopeptidase
MNTSNNPYRLARTVVPRAYRIFLTPDIDAATFTGRVEIDVEVRAALREVTLHAKDLELGAASLRSSGATYRSGQARLDATYQTATFVFDEEIPAGDATMEIAFTGILNDQLTGFYRSTFTDSSGTTHTIATTQFEHSDARQAFPCFDEPSFKATFQVNLTVPAHLATYSNTAEVANVDLGNGQKTVSYAPTMKMSSYLVAFVIGPFEETEAVDVLGTPLRVVYPVGKGHLASLAMEAGQFALAFFSEYFDIPYPGDKLDMIAIPDFAFGAMENLGCITYRETALLVDEHSASLAEKQRVAEVVAHEMAHMWFGDLVTMEWWEGIWLNEAFATFMEVLCTNAFRPQWKMWVDFGINRDMALQVDGLHTTRPIEYEVISPDDIRGMFDVLTYEKGGSVLRMLEQYLGEEVFRDGIRHYLTKHSYANTVTTDLWDALEEVSGQPVRALMNSFILQGGHPLVSLEGTTLTQEPFAYGPASGESAIGETWVVPVLTRSLGETHTSRHLLQGSPVAVSDVAPVVVNAGGSGVYRTRYASNDLATLAARLGELDELERATLVADSWALLFAGKITWADFLAVARGMGEQNEPAPWTTIATAMDFANRALTDEQRPRLAGIVHELFAPAFARLGWEPTAGEDERTGQLRGVLLGTLGTLGADEAVRAEARRRFEAGPLEGDLARSILRVVAHEGRSGDYAFFLERRRNAATPQEEQRYLWGLADFPVVALGLDAAEKCFSEFRNQDAAIELGLLSRNRVSGPDVWRYLVSRWDDVMNDFPPNYRGRVATGVPTFIADDAFAAEVTAFHASHSVGGEQRQVDQQVERLHVGLTFRDALRAQFEG